MDAVVRVVVAAVWANVYAHLHGCDDDNAGGACDAS